MLVRDAHISPVAMLHLYSIALVFRHFYHVITLQ